MQRDDGPDLLAGDGRAACTHATTVAPLKSPKLCSREDQAKSERRRAIDTEIAGSSHRVTSGYTMYDNDRKQKMGCFLLLVAELGIRNPRGMGSALRPQHPKSVMGCPI